MALDRSRGPTSLENPQAGSGSPTNRRLSAVSASSAVLNVPFSEVSHIDSKVSLRFMLKLRGGQQEWQKQGLNTTGHTDTSRKFEYVHERPKSAPPKRRTPQAKPTTPANRASPAMSSAPRPQSGSSRPKRGSKGKKPEPEIITLAPVVPKSKGPPPSGCKNPACVKINAWSWQLEAENDRLREMVSNLLHQEATKQLTQTFDSQTGAVIDTLKHDVERRNKDLKELTFKHQNVTQDRDDMQKTLLQLHQEYAKLKKQYKELKTEHLGLKTRYNLVMAGSGDKLAEELAKPNPTKYTHNGTYGPLPLSQVLSNTDDAPARLLRQLGQDVLDGSVRGLNKAEKVWSCCLQADETAGCTIPSPSHVHDVAHKRKQATRRRKSANAGRARSAGARRKARMSAASSGRGWRGSSSTMGGSRRLLATRSAATLGATNSGVWSVASGAMGPNSVNGLATPNGGAGGGGAAAPGRVMRGSRTPHGTGRGATGDGIPGWRHNAPQLTPQQPITRSSYFDLA